MRQSLSKDIIKTISDPRNLRIVLIVVFINLAIFILGRIYINPYLQRKPCVVCGRPNTRAVQTLWQYEVKIIPCCKDVKLWYCKRHIRTAPDIVKEIPSKKDTVAKRYRQAVIGGTIQMATLFYALVMMRFKMKYFYASPMVIGFAFIIGNITSSLSLTIIFGSIVGIPLLIFYIWIKTESR